jgi:hypothetical protein
MHLKGNNTKTQTNKHTKNKSLNDKVVYPLNNIGGMLTTNILTHIFQNTINLPKYNPISSNNIKSRTTQFTQNVHAALN